MAIDVVNWNRPDDAFTSRIWTQNMTQMWSDEEHVPSDDKQVYENLHPMFQEGYSKALAGLTGLDTLQGNVGLPAINATEKKLQRKSTLSFMQMMEHVHAKSYSTIFTTVITDSNYVNYLLDDWATNHPILNEKVNIISSYYAVANTLEDQFMQRVASVFLESYQFYSGFFLPVYMQGQGLMTSSGEIIGAILRDEAVHGLYIGVLAQELYNMMDKQQQERVKKKTYALLRQLHAVEMNYTEELYDRILLPEGEKPLVEQVKAYVRYNANRALMNLGFDPMFEEEPINSLVLNGTGDNATNITHDFFSQKGFYNKALNVTEVTDESIARMKARFERGRIR